MKYLALEKKISLEKSEVNIIDLGIIELGGPFHSPLAKHLQKFHEQELDRLHAFLKKESQITLNDVPTVIDILQVFLVEPLDKDWGNYYDGIEKSSVRNILNDFQKIYFSQTNEKYDGRYNETS